MVNLVKIVGFCICAGLLITGCGTSIPVGGLYTGVKLPVSGKDAKYSKEGRAVCQSYLSIVALGDCSVEAAAKAGGITDIKVVDTKVENYLGFYGKYTTIVKGD
ncbi:TRL-like family protein [Helicobacter baculiformis]|uniref:TRL-like family protein n=1 Tax=Helicobacter baculiformis TaxID=427351 RepID=A0ABV7ZHE3_9HELI|nr:TRL-like family protein [Helicobacter baculiformis]